MFTPTFFVPCILAISCFHIYERALSLENTKSFLVLVQSSLASLFFTEVGNELKISSHHPPITLRLKFGPVQEINEGLLLREVARAININKSSLHFRIKVLEFNHEGKLVGTPIGEIHHLGMLENCNAPNFLIASKAMTWLPFPILLLIFSIPS